MTFIKKEYIAKLKYKNDDYSMIAIIAKYEVLALL